MTAHIEVWQAGNGRWYFHRRSSNGQVTQASQGYAHKRGAVFAARRDIGRLPIVTPPARIAPPPS